MISAATIVFVVGYSLVALLVMTKIASEGIDEDGHVYDDSAITAGIGLGMVWPLAVFAVVLEKLVVSLGQAFAA